MAQEEFIRVGTTLYKIVNQPRINGGFVKKRIVWNNETLRQDYGKDFIATVLKYDGFCTVPNQVMWTFSVILHQKTSPTSMPTSQRKHVFFSRVLWISCRS